MRTDELIKLWTKTLGEPPTSQQFEIWIALHKPEIIERAILKTAMKNIALGGTMSLDHKARFASQVMLSKTNDKQKAEGQRRNSYGAETYTRRTDQPSEDADRAVDKRGCTAAAADD